jgi:enamine deaminase RidA (YjgF/YER057c/UK114 family)
MTRDVIVPEGDQALYDNFHFAQAVRAPNGLVICSGQIGTGANGKVAESAEDEFRNAWQAVGKVLSAAGMGYENIIEYTTYHVGLQKHLSAFMSVRDEFIQAPWPAWTAIGVSELAVGGARCEIRVTAEASV